MDHDILRDDTIGSTTIELIDRFYSPQWRQLGQLSQEADGDKDEEGATGTPAGVGVIAKPIERRTLHEHGGKGGRGKLELWVDIFTEVQQRQHGRCTPLTTKVVTTKPCSVR